MDMLTLRALETANNTATNAGTTEGMWPSSLAVAVPENVSCGHATPSAGAEKCAMPSLQRTGQVALADETLFYHLLGVSTDVLGFDVNGDLRLAHGDFALLLAEVSHSWIMTLNRTQTL
jgi:hypothetical protein